jgi:hypothetical protein
MSLLLIFSFILIFFHISNLRLITKFEIKESTLENTKGIDDIKDIIGDNSQKISISFLLPTIVILVLSLIEIGYFVFSVFLLKDTIILVGASILTGFSLYELIKFFPKVKLFLKNPIEALKEKTDYFDRTTSFIMTIFEILFCLYVIVKIFLKY